MLALVFINAAGDGGVRITSYGEQIERRELSGDGSLRWHVRGNQFTFAGGGRLGC
jgi:hypothetical protein